MLLALLILVTPMAAMPQTSALDHEDGTQTPAHLETDRSGASSQSSEIPQDGYTADEIVRVAGDFFGETTEGLAKVIERVFREQGKPVAYIAGEEGSGAIGVGLRYGRGTLTYPDGGNMPVYWQGPSIGWDFGGNASKVFTLVYQLRDTNHLFQRYPGVDGSLYFIAGIGVNYQRTGPVTLAPIRTGVGLRAGASVGYLHYTRSRRWIPF